MSGKLFWNAKWNQKFDKFQIKFKLKTFQNFLNSLWMALEDCWIEWWCIHLTGIIQYFQKQFDVFIAANWKLLSIMRFVHFRRHADTSATQALASSSSSSEHHLPTITELLSTKPSHLDYQNFQNDARYVGSMPKQYHSGEHQDLDNEEVDEDFHSNALDRGPFFEVTATKNITAIAGHSAYLNCRVRNLGNRTVSLNPLFHTVSLS